MSIEIKVLDGIYESTMDMVKKASAGAGAMVFEYGMPSPFGEKCTVDGFMEQEDRYVFVLAKFREPYLSEGQPAKAEPAYGELYGYISQCTYGALNCITENGDGELNVSFDCYGEKIEYLDVDQLVRLLTAIASGVLDGRFRDKNPELMYLVYNPFDLEADEAVKEKLLSVYDRLCYEFNSLELSQIFTVILTYLRDEKGMGDISDEEIELLGYNFTVYLCDTELYPQLLV